MAHHRIAHPVDVAGCFGCKALGLGYQGLRARQGPDPTRVTPVVADDGPARGTVVGKQREHWDGRQDAKVHAPLVKMTATTKEHR